MLKALYYSGFTGEAVLCDDSGLEVDALDGAPGVYSARFAGSRRHDEENNNLLLSRLGKTGGTDGAFRLCGCAGAGRAEDQDRAGNGGRARSPPNRQAEEASDMIRFFSTRR